MDYSVNIERKYVGIPIKVEMPTEMLEIFAENEKLYEFRIPVSRENTKCDYYSYINMEKYQGRNLTFRGNLGEHFAASLIQADEAKQPALERPLLHFTAERGWMNDPNGLVWKDGIFQLFFQHNPMGVQWQNMTWGHAVSRDLLRFRRLEPVLYPDKYGTAYSGCGLVNTQGLLGLPRDALLFFYTAAGDTNKWSEGKLFTQRIAYSPDGGNTLIRLPKPTVGEREKETRDPKIFWHEETKAYIMALYTQGNEFVFLRSTNLQDWEQTSCINLPEAWECPDLFRLDGEDGEQWIFTSADGFYYFGQFDGYHYKTDGVQRNMYLTKLPYAAQTYSGVEGRTISISWLRTLNKNKLYRGAMALPRELALVKTDSLESLSLLPVREYEQEKTEIMGFKWGNQGFKTKVIEDVVSEIMLELEDEAPVAVEFFGQKLIIQKNALIYKEEETRLPESFREIHILIDREILEVFGNEGTLNAYYETGSDILQGEISVSGGNGSGKLFEWRR